MSFTSEMGRFSEQTQRRINNIVIGASFDLSRKIIKRTPVGNPDEWTPPIRPPGYTGGSARGNWQASINSPIRSERQNIDSNGNATIAEMMTVAQRSVGQVFYLTNNLPYIERLENGWSQQAPAGMVRVSFAELRRSMSRVISISG